MASPNKTKFLQPQADYKYPIPVTGTFLNKEIAQGQARQGAEVVSSAPVTDVSYFEPSIPEQDNQDGCLTQPSNPAEVGVSPEVGDESDDETLAGPSGKRKQEEIIENENPEASNLAPLAVPNERAGETEVPESMPSEITNYGDYTTPPFEEFRDAWHNCDQCGNIIRCSFKTPQAQYDDTEVDDGTEIQTETPEKQPTARGVASYLTRLNLLHSPLFARLLSRTGVLTTGGGWTDAADYDRTILPPGQGWNGSRNTTPPPSEARGDVDAPRAAAEEEPLYLPVKYDSRPFPDPSGVQNTGERGASYTIVSGIVPSNPYLTVMAKILHRLKGTDGTRNPYPIAPTAQIDYVDIQFGAIAAHAPRFLGRRKIEADNVADLLNYLGQRTGGDDILEVFLVPMNEQDPHEHFRQTFEDWTTERVTEGKGKGEQIGSEVSCNGLPRTFKPWMIDAVLEDEDEGDTTTVEGNDANPAELE